MIRSLILITMLLGGTQAPQRDRPVTPPVVTGAAVVSGTVTLGDDAETPVRRAVVTLSSGDGVSIHSAITDEQGRFAIERVPEGRYTLTAVKPAHLTNAYGARKPGRAGTTVVVSGAQRVEGLRLSLPRGAVLAGRVTLEDGQPLPNTQVKAIPRALQDAGGAVMVEDAFTTDDRGEFRIYGLLPDTYLVAVLPSFGRGEIERRAEAEFDALVQTLKQPSSAARTSNAATALERPRTMGLAPTYFPATPIAMDATPVTVKAGEAREGLDVTVTFVPLATISGRLLGATGLAARDATISAELVGPPLPLQFALGPRSSRPDANGDFTISGVAPGRYTIRARAGGVTTDADGNVVGVRSDRQTDFAVADVNVIGTDISGVSLQLQAGHTFSGRVTASGAETTGATVVVQPITRAPTRGSTVSGGPSPRRATVGTDSTFEVTGLEPGNYEVRVTLPTGLTGTWAIGAMRQGDRDLRDAPLTFSNGSIAGVEVVLTTERSELAGRLTSESGTPATDYFIVAFPADRNLWHAASPRVQVTRPAADGMFSIRDLLPGSYRLAALIDVDDDEPRQREFLESIYEASIAVTIDAGKTTRQEIRIK